MEARARFELPMLQDLRHHLRRPFEILLQDQDLVVRDVPPAGNKVAMRNVCVIKRNPCRLQRLPQVGDELGMSKIAKLPAESSAETSGRRVRRGTPRIGQTA